MSRAISLGHFQVKKTKSILKERERVMPLLTTLTKQLSIKIVKFHYNQAGKSVSETFSKMGKKCPSSPFLSVFKIVSLVPKSR